ncbi:chitotriosidase-1-like [Amphiura filiformis]|uniref:chitotriosidase-1-like n=1 Tax=Amphiura filiformis TaxID=82378 RepID=UPI003B21A09A
MCTHLIYAFARVDKDTFHIEPTDVENDIIGMQYYKQFTGLKIKNPSLKTLLAVGGRAHASEGFTQMVKTADSRKIFIDYSIEYLRKYNFDGLDLHWEYPCIRGGAPSDKAGYADLVQDLLGAYNTEAHESGRERLLITMAAPGDEYITDIGYDIRALTMYLDFVNLKAFDLQGPLKVNETHYPPWEHDLGHHASLFPGNGDDTFEVTQTVSHSVEENWIKRGCPPKKLIVGLALYGRAWTVYPDSGSCTINDYAPEPSSPGPYTGEDGFWGYFEICTKLKAGMTVYRDDQRKVPFGCDGIEWVGYDDYSSFSEKANYIQWGGQAGLFSEGLGGGMVWALDLDDFTGNLCDNGPWPLMRNVRTLIREGLNWPTTVPLNRPTTPPPTTFCKDNGYTDGLYAHGQCNHWFYHCDHGITNVMQCENGLLFDDILKICNWPENIPGCVCEV